MRRKECINDVELFSITKLSVLQKEKQRNYTSQTMIVPSFLFLINEFYSILIITNEHISKESNPQSGLSSILRPDSRGQTRPVHNRKSIRDTCRTD